MIYPDNFEQKTGFDEIRQMLADRCICSLGVQLVQEMQFQTDFQAVETPLDQTMEFMRILQEGKSFPDQNYHDLREALSRIKVIGTWLDEAELLCLWRSLETISGIVEFLNREENQGLYPNLSVLAESVAVFPSITQGISRILTKFGKLKDNASPELYRIRMDLTNTSFSISRILNGILKQAQTDGYVDKDAAPTMRDGRLVLPVAPGLKRKIRGIVHDESASGKTVFIEPEEVVEANNRIRELEADEKREVMRILVAFTDTVRPEIPSILESYAFMAQIDFIRAKARLAIDFDACKPILEHKTIVDWVQAVHPLLRQSLARHEKSVVPLDIELDTKNSILLISGPNAGGKSVCLKTVGLLQYMLQCGIPVPMRPNSHAGIFKSIFIDIGDEQSIDDDLSTYSSHLLNMKNMIKHADNRSLILIDEFGSGTEPNIGGAIAEAVLMRFNRNRVFGIITTHYGNLKMFPDRYPQAVNGAMLFDVQAMRPLFLLSIGKPGSSFTYEIARKIGLPAAIIDAAIGKSGTAQIDYEAKLEEIEVEKIALDNELKRMQQADEKLAELISLYDDKFRNFDKVRKEILQKAKNQANAIIENANKVIENTIREIKENKADKEKTKQARTEIHKVKQELAKEVESVEQEEIVRPILPKKKPEKKVQSAIPDTTPLKAGDSVFIDSIQTVGEVVSIKGEDVTVSFNSVSFKTTIDKVEKISKREGRTIQRAAKFDGGSMSEMMNRKVAMFQTTLDLRGERAEDALALLENYIDEAVLLSIHQVKILHGKGNGILRARVREFLAKRKEVESFRDEVLEAGGSGITIVEL